MVFQGGLPIRLFYLICAGATFHAQHLIVIPFCHIKSRDATSPPLIFSFTIPAAGPAFRPDTALLAYHHLAVAYDLVVQFVPFLYDIDDFPLLFLVRSRYLRYGFMKSVSSSCRKPLSPTALWYGAYPSTCSR